MKKLITTISACLISVMCLAQTFSVSADTINTTSDISLYPSDYIYFTNTSGGAMDFSFDVVTNTIPAPGWTATLCTDVVCMPTIPSTYNFGNYTNGAGGFLNMHVSFNGAVGTGEIGFKIYETSNPSNFQIVYFIYTGISATGIADNSDKVNISTFPNPTTNVLNIKGLENISNGSFDIYNVTGSLIFHGNVTSSNQIVDVSGFSNGLYFVNVKNKEGSIFTSRFVKK